MNAEIDITKRYRTRDGREVTDLSISVAGAYPVSGIMNGEKELWTRDGFWYLSRRHYKSDLILVEEESEEPKLPQPPEGVNDEIDITKRYRTRDGRDVTDLFDEGQTWVYAIRGRVEGIERWWTRTGKSMVSVTEHPHDLVPDEVESVIPAPPEGYELAGTLGDYEGVIEGYACTDKGMWLENTWIGAKNKTWESASWPFARKIAGTQSVDDSVVDMKRDRDSARQTAEEWAKEITRLNEEIVRLGAESNAWIETAQQHLRNEQYYRDLLVQCGQSIGKDAYTCDDGTMQGDVLVAKVPDLVQMLVAINARFADVLTEPAAYPVVGDTLRHKRYGWEKRVEALTQFTIELERGDQVQKLVWMEEWDIVTPTPTPAAYPPPESEWPEKPAPPEGCVWVRQGDEGRSDFSDIRLVQQPDGILEWHPIGEGMKWVRAVVFRAEKIDHTEGGKYRMLEVGEKLKADDQVLLDVSYWRPLGKDGGTVQDERYRAYPVGYYRRPVKSEEPDLPDYAQQAKDILQNHFGYFADIRDAELDTLVDLILKAAKQS
jgi:hypothetical protein